MAFEVGIKHVQGKDAGGGWIDVSTGDIDRDGDVILVTAWDIENWKRAGSNVLWGHDYSDVFSIIGTAEARITDRALQIKPNWRRPVTGNDKMHVIQELWNSGAARSFSVGFIPRQWEPMDTGGKLISEAELLEISLVTIGANPMATRGAKSFERALARRMRQRHMRDLTVNVLDRILQLPDGDLSQLAASGVLQDFVEVVPTLLGVHWHKAS